MLLSGGLSAAGAISKVILGCTASVHIHEGEHEILAEVLESSYVSEGYCRRQDILDYQQLKDALNFEEAQLLLVDSNLGVLTEPEDSKHRLAIAGDRPLTVHLVVQAIAVNDL